MCWEFFSLIIMGMRENDNVHHSQYFWMSAGSFDDLFRWVNPHIKHGSTSVRLWVRLGGLAVTIHFLSSGISQRTLAASFKLGSATVSCSVREVCYAVWRGLWDEFAAFPEGEQWVVIESDFWELWNYPNCVGAIDGKHISERTSQRWH